LLQTFGMQGDVAVRL